MDLLLWITIGFIIIGFVVLVSMKKGMDSKVAFIKALLYSSVDFHLEMIEAKDGPTPAPRKASCL